MLRCEKIKTFVFVLAARNSVAAELALILLKKKYPVELSLTKMCCFVQPTTEQLRLTLTFNVIPLAVQHV